MKVLKKVEKQRLAKLAHDLITRKFKVRFDMEDYASSNKGILEISPRDVKNECGTSCCFLGHAPFVFPEISKDYGDWSKLLHTLFPSMYDDYDLAAFLFGPNWGNNKNQAAQRALVVLQDQYNPDWDLADKYKHPGKVSPDDFKKWMK